MNQLQVVKPMTGEVLPAPSAEHRIEDLKRMIAQHHRERQLLDYAPLGVCKEREEKRIDGEIKRLQNDIKQIEAAQAMERCPELLTDFIVATICHHEEPNATTKAALDELICKSRDVLNKLGIDGV